MKTVKSVLPKMAGFFLVMLIITSVIYPAVITAAANVAFGHEANGSVIVGKDGTKYGSALLAQEFTGNQYLWGRVMNVDTGTFTDENGEPLAYAGASNKTPAGSELEAMIAERVEKIRAAHPEKGEEPIPVDLVTCSGSGPGNFSRGSRLPGRADCQGTEYGGGGCGGRHQQVYHGQVPGNVRRAQSECAESESGSGWIDLNMICLWCIELPRIAAALQLF